MSENGSERQRADVRSDRQQHREAMSENGSERQRADARSHHQQRREAMSMSCSTTCMKRVR